MATYNSKLVEGTLTTLSNSKHYLCPEPGLGQSEQSAKVQQISRIHGSPCHACSERVQPAHQTHSPSFK